MGRNLNWFLRMIVEYGNIDPQPFKDTPRIPVQEGEEVAGVLDDGLVKLHMLYLRYTDKLEKYEGNLREQYGSRHLPDDVVTELDLKKLEVDTLLAIFWTTARDRFRKHVCEACSLGIRQGMKLVVNPEAAKSTILADGDFPFSYHVDKSKMH